MLGESSSWGMSLRIRPPMDGLTTPGRRGHAKNEGAFRAWTQQALRVSASPLPGLTSRGEVNEVIVAAYVHALVTNLLERARQEERGQTMAEYAVILTVITVLVLAALLFLGGRITGVIERVGSVIN
jgi:Flp pilus assembly pilin Flp